MFLHSLIYSCGSMLVGILMTKSGLYLVSYAALQISCILVSQNDRCKSNILKDSQLQL